MEKRRKVDLKESWLWLLVCVLVLTSGSSLQAKAGEDTKIFTIFVSKGCSCPGPHGRVAKGLTANDELLDELQMACS